MHSPLRPYFNSSSPQSRDWSPLASQRCVASESAGPTPASRMSLFALSDGTGCIRLLSRAPLDVPGMVRKGVLALVCKEGSATLPPSPTLCSNLGSESLRRRMVANFGFMFSFTGRTVFILFCATVM